MYKYHLFDGFEDPSSWASTWYMQYQGYYGVEAMELAIDDKYFDFIILNDYFTKYVNDQLADNIEENYDLVMTENYKLFGEYDSLTRVWVPKSTSTE